MGFLKLFKQSTNLQIQGFYFTANLSEKKIMKITYGQLKTVKLQATKDKQEVSL